eukprot:symbB.v1.2.041678.t1/scaffold8491.1/size6119/1
MPKNGAGIFERESQWTWNLWSAAPRMAMCLLGISGALQNKWPTTFDYSKSYLHVDELWQSNSPVEYENSDGDQVKLIPETGKLLLELNGVAKGEVTEL